MTGLLPFPLGRTGLIDLSGDEADALWLRPATASDLGFLLALYASFRTDELSAAPWTAAEKTAFLTDQFQLQHRDFVMRFADGDFLVVEDPTGPIGRLYLHADEEGLLVVDIGLLAKARGKGVAGRLLRWAEERAGSIDAPRLWLHVAPWNAPALRLYRAMGLEVIETGQTSLTMEKRLAVRAEETGAAANSQSLCGE